MSAQLSAWIFSILILSAFSPLSALSLQTKGMNATADGESTMSARVEVELDIFSGNPNPVWILQEADEILFQKKIALLPQASATDLSDNLGYRGLIAKVINETGERIIRIQNGTVQISQDGTNIYYSDPNRHLEKWLLNSGKSILRSDLYNMVEIGFPENSTIQSRQLST